VAFDVTEGQQVCNFDITVDTGTFNCHLLIGTCTDIVDSDFEYAIVTSDTIATLTGTFDQTTHALGHYRVPMCGGTLVFPAPEGGWEASK
jgi:hypothetical protein